MSDDKNLDLFKEVREADRKALSLGRKLRVGFIGTGGIAHSHMRAYKQFDDVEVVAGADLVPGRAAAFFREFGIEAADYTDYKKMIAECRLDAVSVCTYNRQHAGPASYALEHGLSVLLEKPFAVTLEEAAGICRAEKSSGKILSIGFQPRFDPNMQMIGKIFRSGELGRIYYIQTGGGRRRGIPCSGGKDSFIREDTAGIGAVGDIGCYSLDMVLNALGYPKPVTVSGYMSDFFGKDPGYSGYKGNGAVMSEKFGVDDFAAAFIRFETGLVVDFRISWAMNMDTSGDTIVLGTKGGLRIPSTECWNGTVGGPMTVYKEVAGEQTETVLPVLEIKGLGRIEQKVRSFCDAAIGIILGDPDAKSPVPSSQIIINQAIIDGIVRSARLGREVEIVIPEI